MKVLKILIAVVLFIDSFSHISKHIKSRLVVSAGCMVGAGTLSQANIYRPHCSAQVALYTHALGQSVSQPVSQSVSQSVSSQLVSLSVSQSVSHTDSHSVNPSVILSVILPDT